ncbi:MAG: hypothetical protein R2739_03855 [Chitinophagales bacterium]
METLPPNHNREAQDRINMLVDGELDNSSRAEVLREMESDEEMQQLYKNQLAYKRSLTEKVQRMSCGEELKEQLIHKIRGH